MSRKRARLSAQDYVDGVLAGDRAILGRAITLVESNRAQHQDLAQEVLVQLLPHTGNAHRIGITGVPGVGKSTFIEGFGRMLIDGGEKVAVLAIDPSSRVTHGSILGDKTRMAFLSRDKRAFIRPSPTGGSLGGVARKTRESMLICEAAGYGVVIVETVGVGQSETVVKEMVDIFLVLMLSGAGDELQGIKRGILELADLIAVNKADGDNVTRARLAAKEYKMALRYTTPSDAPWKPRVTTCSALEGTGMDKLWELIREHRTQLTDSGAFQANRQRQLVGWMWSMVEEQVLNELHRDEDVRAIAKRLESEVAAGTTTATLAAQAILEARRG